MKEQKAISRNKIQDIDQQLQRTEQIKSQMLYERTLFPGSLYYGGVDPRRRQELSDGGMIRESKTAVANLPEQFIHTEYPKNSFYCTPYLDDVEE